MDSVLSFSLNGAPVAVDDIGASLLDLLREQLGVTSVKDGCSPQGQCGCCTVWVDGSARVSCVTPARRVAGRSVTTVEGLDPETARRWVDAFSATGASQCGFCTPGIVMRLASLEARAGFDETKVRTALAAHLCRCTGWQSIVDAASLAAEPAAPHARRDPLLAAWRAQIEGGVAQSSGPEVVLGGGGFADDRVPAGALVALADEEGSYVVAETLGEARAVSAKVQGRNTTIPLSYPLEVPDGEWELTLRTTWVEPGYLEPDASWSTPGSCPATPLANGGAFGGKRSSPVPAEAQALADEHGRAVRVLWPRETVVRRGPKRPPVALGLNGDGSGVLRFAALGAPDETDTYTAAVATVEGALRCEPVAVAGPAVSAALRAAGWAEALIASSALAARQAGWRRGDPVEVSVRGGGRAAVSIGVDDRVRVEVWAGEVLDATTLRSFCQGAVHQALGWVWSEGIALDDRGVPVDLTIRSFGILSARETPAMDVTLHPESRWPVNGSDAVFCATAAAAWLHDGLAPQWPTRRPGAAR